MRLDGTVTPSPPWGPHRRAETLPVRETSPVGDPGRAPLADPGKEKGGLPGALRRFVSRRRVDALLRRTLRPYRRGSGAVLTFRVLTDIGLPPDFRM